MLRAMPVCVVFRCDVCGSAPDPETQHRTVGPRPWEKGPHPWAGRRGTDRARRLARGLQQTFGR